MLLIFIMASKSNNTFSWLWLFTDDKPLKQDMQNAYQNVRLFVLFHLAKTK